MGETTNNDVEFTALEQGLRLLIRLGKGLVIVEGDSQLAITTLRKIQHGMKLSKAVKHWRLVAVTEIMAQHLASLSSIILQAVRRKANALADCLANYVVDHPREIIDTCWQDITSNDLQN